VGIGPQGSKRLYLCVEHLREVEDAGDVVDVGGKKH
jgi:hypothetical protein